jgi:hypothetical protein
LEVAVVAGERIVGELKFFSLAQASELRCGNPARGKRAGRFEASKWFSKDEELATRRRIDYGMSPNVV